jgi:hypothetical protein
MPANNDAVVTVSHAKHGHVGRISVAWTADSGDGSFPDTVLPVFEGRLAELTTDPGAVAPTDNYDITLVDANAVDRLQGVGANRDTANTETAPVVYASSTIHPPIGLWDVLTLKLANNAVHSATGLIVLIYVPV